MESGRHCGKEAGGEGMGREASEGGGRGKQRVGRRGGMGVCGRGQDGAGMGQRGVGRRVGRCGSNNVRHTSQWCEHRGATH